MDDNMGKRVQAQLQFMERNGRALEEVVAKMLRMREEQEGFLHGFAKALQDIGAQEDSKELAQCLLSLGDCGQRLASETHDVMLRRPEGEVLLTLTQIQDWGIVPMKRLLEDREKALKIEYKLQREYDEKVSGLGGSSSGMTTLHGCAQAVTAIACVLVQRGGSGKEKEKKLRMLSDQKRRVENVNALIEYHLTKFEEFRILKMKESEHMLRSSVDDLRHESVRDDELFLGGESAAAGATDDCAACETSPRASARESRQTESSDWEREVLKQRADWKAQCENAKPRKSSYQVQKVLESQLELLKQRAGISDVCVKEKTLANDAMQEVVHAQQLSVAKAQAAIAGFSDAYVSNPLTTYVRLGTNWDERRETLRAMKDTKLRRAYEYVAARSELLDPFRSHGSGDACENANGDKCGSRFDSTPLHGVQSVKQVYDALLYYLMNAEITISERFGYLTVREDYDSVDDSIYNYRLVSNTNGILIESNAILFSEYYDHHKFSGGGPCGVVVVDFVDDDALYPYAPSERVRKDITVAFVLTPHMKHTQCAEGKEQKDELVVTMARAAFAKLHFPQCDISPHDIQDLNDAFSGWGQMLLKVLKETLQSLRE